MQAAGIVALGAIVGLSEAIVLAAAERPSFLSGPARHGFSGWMVGPFAHRLASLPNDTPALEADLTRALVVLAVAWLVVTLCASRLPAAVVWAAVVATQAAFLLGPPLSLTDLFNYLHYGRMAANYGLNPYVALPTAAPADPAYPFTNWHHLPSPYGPLFTALTEGLGPMHLATAYWAWKAIAAAAALGTLVVVAVTARRLGRSPQAGVALVGLNPLVLVYGVGGVHNEPLLLLCAVGAVALAVRGRHAGVQRFDVGAGACAVLAAGFKPSAALLVPLVILGCRRRWAALAGAAGAAVFVAALAAALYGAGLPSTGIQERLVTPFSAPNVLAALAGHGGMNAHDRALAHVALALAAVVAIGAVAWRRAWLPGAVGFAMLAAVLTLGWTMPWYVWWVLPFAALARTRALAVVCVLLTVWLGLGAIPESTSLLHDAGYYPTRSAVGRANHLYVERYLR